MSISFGGLDTNSIISQLMATEQKPRERVVLQQQQVQTRTTALKDIQGKLQALRNAAADLRLPSTWGNVQTLGVSDKAVAGAKLTGAAGTGDRGHLRPGASPPREFDSGRALDPPIPVGITA